MEREYDIFEVFPDGSPLWRGAVSGHENAVDKLRELAATTKNEVRIMHMSSNTLIAAMNIPKS